MQPVQVVQNQDWAAETGTLANLNKKMAEAKRSSQQYLIVRIGQNTLRFGFI